MTAVLAGHGADSGAQHEVFLGFDFGERRIGAAVGGSLTCQARPLPAINNGRQPDWDTLRKLLNEWRPAGCVVGLPVDLEGKEQPVTALARSFAVQLRTRYGVPVYLVDERLTSRVADTELRSARADGRLNRRVKSGDRDGVAARLILEQWLSDGASRALLAAIGNDQSGADYMPIGGSGRKPDPGFWSEAGRAAENAGRGVSDSTGASPGTAETPTKHPPAVLEGIANERPQIAAPGFGETTETSPGTAAIPVMGSPDSPAVVDSKG